MSDTMCILCREPKSNHIQPLLKCPTYTYYTPCKHLSKTGTATFGSDGTLYGEATCNECGERLTGEEALSSKP